MTATPARRTNVRKVQDVVAVREAQPEGGRSAGEVSDGCSQRQRSGRCGRAHVSDGEGTTATTGRDDVGHPRFVLSVRGEDVAQGRCLGATPSGGGGQRELLGRELVDDRAERGIREKEEFLLVHAATVHPASDAPQSLVFVAGEEQTCTDT